MKNCFLVCILMIIVTAPSILCAEEGNEENDFIAYVTKVRNSKIYIDVGSQNDVLEGDVFYVIQDDIGKGEIIIRQVYEDSAIGYFMDNIDAKEISVGAKAIYLYTEKNPEKISLSDNSIGENKSPPVVADGKNDEKKRSKKKGVGIFVCKLDFAQITNAEAYSMNITTKPGGGIEYRGRNWFVAYSQNTVKITGNMAYARLNIDMLTLDYLHVFEDSAVPGFFLGAGRTGITFRNDYSYDYIQAVGAWNIVLGFDIGDHASISYLYNLSDDSSKLVNTSLIKGTFTF